MAETLSEVRFNSGNLVPLIRPRLLERLKTAATFPITLIIAPAGYGKSMLLRQYLDAARETTVRFAVRAEHGQLLGFLRGFTEALGSHVPHASTSLAGAYERNQASPRRAADLARWMQSHLQESFSGTIAVDDLHNSVGDEDVACFIATLIESCSERVSWILASRSTAGLPVGSWLAYHRADLPIGEMDLRFTFEEAAAAAREAGLHVGQDEIRNLLHITEGWPAALTFALATSTRSSDLRNLSALTREMTYRFLAEQVYHGLTADERDLLEVAIALPAIDTAVLELAGFDRALQIVETLHERTAFISQESASVYRCHDLFRDFLRHQSALGGKKAQQRVNERAARALERSGDVEHAVAAYVAAGCKDDILRLLEQSGFDLLERAQSDVVARAIDVLDERLKNQHGCALALQGALHAMAGRPSRAEAFFRRALDALDSDEVSANTALRLASILANAGKDASSILSRIESDRTQSIAYRAEAASFIAAQKAVNGHYQAAAMAVDRTLEMMRGLEVESSKARILHKIGIAYHHLGKIELAENALRLSSDIAMDLHLFAVASRANAVLSNLALQADEISRQMHYATCAKDAAAKAGDTFAWQTAVLQILSVETRLGRSKEAEAAEQSLLAIGSTDIVNRHISIFRAIRLAWEGRFDEAQTLLSPTWAALPFDFDRMTCGSAYALFLALDRKRMGSIGVLQDVVPLFEKCTSQGSHKTRAIAIARSFCAMAETINGRATRAQRLLKPLKNESDRICSLFYTVAREFGLRVNKKTLENYAGTAAIARLINSDYHNVGAIFKAAFDRTESSMLPTRDRRDLTAAEIAVLKDLDSGLSAKEIAEISGRSINTVRAHIARAAIKLECSGQAQAVRSAKSLGLL